MVCIPFLPSRPLLVIWLAPPAVGGVSAALLRPFAAPFLHRVEQYFGLLAAFGTSWQCSRREVAHESRGSGGVMEVGVVAAAGAEEVAIVLDVGGCVSVKTDSFQKTAHDATITCK